MKKKTSKSKIKSEVRLEIVLRGRSNSGKTEVMQIIAEALRARGIHGLELYMGRRAPECRIDALSQPPKPPYDDRRIAVIEEWGTGIPSYPSEAPWN